MQGHKIAFVELVDRDIKTLNALLQGTKTIRQLASECRVSVKTMKKDIEYLKYAKLVKTSRKGVEITPLGIQFLESLAGAIRNGSNNEALFEIKDDTAEEESDQ